MKELFITSFTSISKAGFVANGELLLANQGSADELLKGAYKAMNLSYPKFFKMDVLGKLGIIGSEPFFADESLKSHYKEDEIALVLANRSSSMESDLNHHNNFTEGKASPAVFVYTLPNIVIGEICIRHQLFSESNFYIFEDFEAEQLLLQAQVLIDQSSAKACILGWVEGFGENFEATFYLLEENGQTVATADRLKKIMNDPINNQLGK